MTLEFVKKKQIANKIFFCVLTLVDHWKSVILILATGNITEIQFISILTLYDVWIVRQSINY